MNSVNIAGYRFITLSPALLPSLQNTLKTEAIALDIRGTILLSTEGINIFLAGTESAIERYQQVLCRFPEFTGIAFHRSYSQERPFSRIKVRIKNELITMGCGDIVPEKSRAPYIEPEVLKQWYDEQRDFVILDTRNDFEVAVGSFEQAIDLNIEHFRAFPDSIRLLPESLKNKPIVTFCTGGIRCEKAATLMQKKGFTKVYQLKGGILNYFKKVGGHFYRGDCFVFDDRIKIGVT